MKTIWKHIFAALLLLFVMTAVATPAFAAGEEAPAAEEQTVDLSTASKAMGAGIVVGLAALGGAIAMGMAISKSVDGISRQPEADGKIRSALMLGLVFIETVVIYALIVAILLIFVL